MQPSVYTVVFTRRAQKDINGLDVVITRRVSTAIGALSTNPHPPGCLRIVSEDGVWRIRVGDYRVAYTIDDKAQVVTISRIGHRCEFYG